MTQNGPHRENDRELPLEEQLRALGLGSAPGETRHEAGHPRILDTADLQARVRELGADLVAQRRRVQELERTLVERIADVDDDRRRGQAQVQRAIQSHRDELAGGHARRYGWLLFALASVALAGGIGGYFLHGQQMRQAAELRGQIEQARVEASQLQSIADQDERMDEKLARLSTAVSALSEALGRRLEGTPAQEGAALAALEERLSALSARQDGLLERIESSARAPEQQAPDPVPAPAAAPAPAQNSEDIPGSPPLQTSEPEIGSAETAQESPTPTAPEQVAEADPDPAPGGTAAVQISADKPVALQLIGFHSMPELREFIARHDFPDTVLVYRERFRGRPWYALIHSLHSDAESARLAAAQLGTGLAGLDFWVRTLPTGSRLELEPSKPKTDPEDDLTATEPRLQ